VLLCQVNYSTQYLIVDGNEVERVRIEVRDECSWQEELWCSQVNEPTPDASAVMLTFLNPLVDLPDQEVIWAKVGIPKFVGISHRS
jgi:hypothetical protein